jgi:hypothetical protein
MTETFFDGVRCFCEGGGDGAGGRMEFGSAGGASEIGEFSAADAGTGHDRDASICSGQKLGDVGSAFDSRWAVPGGEYARATVTDDFFEGLSRIRGEVEGAMESGFHWARGGDEFRGARAIDVVFGVEEAEDDAIDLKFAAEFDVTFHGREFCVGVNEITATWADHDEERDVQEFACGLDDSGARGDASDRGVGTEFDAVGSGGLCGESVGEGVGADLDDRHAGDCTRGVRRQTFGAGRIEVGYALNVRGQECPPPFK